MTPTQDEIRQIVERLRDNRKGCPTCNGVDPKTCLRCQGRIPMWYWAKDDAANLLSRLAQQEPCAWTSGIKWSAHQTEQTIKVTRQSQPKYGFTAPLFVAPVPAPKGEEEK